MAILNSILIQYRLVYSFLLMIYLRNMAVVKPMSIKRFINPNTKLTRAFFLFIREDFHCSIFFILKVAFSLFYIKVNPISANKLVKPKTNTTMANKPKSDLSRKRVKIEILSSCVTAKNIVDTVVHFAPDMDFFILTIY